jgi:hypothetical protein
MAASVVVDCALPAELGAALDAAGVKVIGG